MKCSRCEETGWVCEAHPDKPWEGEHACGPRCNPSDENVAPRPPKGFRTEFDKKGVASLAIGVGRANSKIRSRCPAVASLSLSRTLPDISKSYRRPNSRSRSGRLRLKS